MSSAAPQVEAHRDPALRGVPLAVVQYNPSGDLRCVSSWPPLAALALESSAWTDRVFLKPPAAAGSHRCFTAQVRTVFQCRIGLPPLPPSCATRLISDLLFAPSFPTPSTLRPEDSRIHPMGASVPNGIVAVSYEARALGVKKWVACLRGCRGDKRGGGSCNPSTAQPQPRREKGAHPWDLLRHVSCQSCQGNPPRTQANDGHHGTSRLPVAAADSSPSGAWQGRMLPTDDPFWVHTPL